MTQKTSLVRLKTSAVCGGDGIADGACDCDGNVEDALGVCGGDCAADEDMDGICDDEDDCVGKSMSVAFAMEMAFLKEIATAKATCWTLQENAVVTRFAADSMALASKSSCSVAWILWHATTTPWPTRTADCASCLATSVTTWTT